MDERVGRAQRIVEQNQYLTLATADANGKPWCSTVWYAAWGRVASLDRLGVEFIWLSWPEARHSRNLSVRPEVGISIFDSTQAAGAGDGLQFDAHARRVPSAELDEAVSVFSRASVAAGGGAWTRGQVEEPAVPRLHVARMDSGFLLGGGTRVDLPLA
jgi:uncharacterized protein YhbP (UPF0306 family)